MWSAVRARDIGGYGGILRPVSEEGTTRKQHAPQPPQNHTLSTRKIVADSSATPANIEKQIPRCTLRPSGTMQNGNCRSLALRRS